MIEIQMGRSESRETVKQKVEGAAERFARGGAGHFGRVLSGGQSCVGRIQSGAYPRFGN
ncbi:hypothetical protein SDC9_97883 [bioreactor metagenome]|uniref:Uncharacterized protein n=1 Tax=bioreactor metagenome TaxID=1076179 RepID=A0A645ADU3_9ZZZZ